MTAAPSCSLSVTTNNELDTSHGGECVGKRVSHLTGIAAAPEFTLSHSQAFLHII